MRGIRLPAAAWRGRCSQWGRRGHDEAGTASAGSSAPEKQELEEKVGQKERGDPLPGEPQILSSFPLWKDCVNLGCKVPLKEHVREILSAQIPGLYRTLIVLKGRKETSKAVQQCGDCFLLLSLVLPCSASRPYSLEVPIRDWRVGEREKPRGCLSASESSLSSGSISVAPVPQGSLSLCCTSTLRPAGVPASAGYFGSWAQLTCPSHLFSLGVAAQVSLFDLPSPPSPLYPVLWVWLLCLKYLSVYVFFIEP